ncbi:hypothetical protein D3C71_1219650 [compost metagenome]
MLGRTHIGALAQRLGRDCQRQFCGGLRHGGTGGQGSVERAGHLACQHGQAVARLRQAGFQAGNLRGGLLGRCTGLLGDERGGEPGLQAPLRDLQGLLLAGQVAARNGKALLQPAQLDVVDGHLGGQRHLHVGQAGLCRAGVSLAGAHAAAQAAKHIGLPARIKTGLEGVARAVAGPAALCRSRCTHAGQQAGRLHIHLRTRLLQRGLGGAHVGVGPQGLFYQRGERRVVKTLPPLGQRRGTLIGSCIATRARSPRRWHGDGGQLAILGLQACTARYHQYQQRGERYLYTRCAAPGVGAQDVDSDAMGRTHGKASLEGKPDCEEPFRSKRTERVNPR